MTSDNTSFVDRCLTKKVGTGTILLVDISLSRMSLSSRSGKKPKTKAPKIQRLITPVVIQRKKQRLSIKKKRSQKRRDEAAAYAKLLAHRMKEAKERKAERRRSASQSKSRDSRTESTTAK